MIKEGEFGLIARIKGIAGSVPEGVLGIGDDCAVIPQRSGLDTLVSTDMLVEGTHFILAEVDPWKLGWKSAAVNLSDIAAMGGTPTATFLSLALPGTLDSDWMQRFMDGYRAVCGKFGVPLLGGDTTSSPDRLCINVAVMGSCQGGSARLRSAALPGDVVCVTGTLGDSAAGLRLILEGGIRPEEGKVLVDRHYLPQPRIDEGRALSPSIHAMMDISDGIASDLQHILDVSGVSAEIDIAAVPLSPDLLAVCSQTGWDPLQLALCGGEDYELLFTMPADTAVDVPHTVIGRITEACGSPRIIWKGAEGRSFKGFTHF